MRALSPGINDPVTAIACVDYLGAALCALAERKVPSPARRDEDGQVRIIMPVVAFPGALDAAFDQIRQYGGSSVAVTVRMFEALAVIAPRVRRAEDRAALRRHAKMLERSAKTHFEEANDRASVQARLDALRV